jgi:hypothetical protein
VKAFGVLIIRESLRDKFQAPNPKSETIPKLKIQMSNKNLSLGNEVLRFGHWNLVIVLDLEIGIWDF